MKTLLLLVSLLAAHPALSQLNTEDSTLVTQSKTRPNILFAFADDWGYYASAYAAHDAKPGPNSVIKTPNFDRIAKEGVLFTNAYVTSPSCTPCRSSLLSGQYFFRTGLGAILQGAQWDPKIPTYPLILKKAGYHIGQTYKVWSPGTPRDAPYGGKEHEYESAGRRFNGFSQNVTKMVAQGQSVEDAKQVLYDEVLANFDSFLKDRPDDAPFCYWFGPTNVHRKWTKGSGKNLWGLNPDDLKGKLPAFLPDVHEVRQDMADYLGEAMAFDAALGHLLKRLEKIGELDNTMVVVSGDHGIPGFSRGKCNLYDFGTHVPLAVRWPGKAKSDRVVTDFVNLMDLAPTFIEAGGSSPAKVMTGRSIVDVLKSPKSGRVQAHRSFVLTGRERHVASANDGLPYPQRAIRTDNYLYVRNFKPDRWPAGKPGPKPGDAKFDAARLDANTFFSFADMDASPTKTWIITHAQDEGGQLYHDYAFAKRPAVELYDLKNDPDQIVNVANNPEHAKARSRLDKQLMKALQTFRDPRVQGDGTTFDKPPYASPFAKPKPAKKE